MPSTVLTPIACPLCGSALSYVGRPCPACISPAAFALKESQLSMPEGAVRGSAPILHRPHKKVRVDLAILGTE